MNHRHRRFVYFLALLFVAASIGEATAGRRCRRQRRLCLFRRNPTVVCVPTQKPSGPYCTLFTFKCSEAGWPKVEEGYHASDEQAAIDDAIAKATAACGGADPIPHPDMSGNPAFVICSSSTGYRVTVTVQVEGIMDAIEHTKDNASYAEATKQALESARVEARDTLSLGACDPDPNVMSMSVNARPVPVGPGPGPGPSPGP